jgi:ribosomal-protein-alanine acetyltransferase
VSLKTLLFRILGKDPEAVVVSFCSGPPELAQKMVDEVRRLVPDRAHYAVAEFDVAGVERIRPTDLPGPLRRKRIGLAPVLFAGGAEHRGLRLAAFRMAPGKVLAYNSNLERHHLRLRTWIASLLFLRGVPLDRIWLRPSWLYPFKHDRSSWPGTHAVHEGKALTEGRPRVAILSPYYPFPLSHGGAVRIFNLVREASKHYDVFLFAFAEKVSAAANTPVLDYVAKAVVFENPRYREPRWASILPPEAKEFYSPYVRQVLDQWRTEYGLKLLQVEYTQMARYGGDVLVEHDVTFDLHAQVHACEQSLRSWWDLWRWRRFEIRAVQRYARVVAMSEKDAQLLGTANTVVIPNGVDVHRFQPQREQPGSRVLFVGSFAHFPNVIAYRFFVEEVWPLLASRVPDLRLTVIAGRNPDLYWKQPPPDERIEFYGFISDVRPFYDNCNVVVVPTRVSAGTNLKVLEAMAMERAVVSTTSGCAGLGLRHGESVWIADTAEEFARAVEELLRNDTLRRTIALNARKEAEARFDWTHLGFLQRQLWNELAAGMPVRLRQGTHSDLPSIARVQLASHGASQWAPDTYFAFNVMVAERESELAGFMVTRITAPGEIEVLNIAVAPEFRRRGIATLLLDSLVADEVFLEVRESNLPAQELYRKTGFQIVGRREDYYDDPVETALVMRRGRKK